MLNECKASFEGDENVLELAVTVAQHCKVLNATELCALKKNTCNFLRKLLGVSSLLSSCSQELNSGQPWWQSPLTTEPSSCASSPVPVCLLTYSRIY